MPSTVTRPLADLDRTIAGARRLDLGLLAACLVAAIPMLYLAAHQFVEYDGFWHVFIAQQDNWRNFWWEYMHNDHPLLFYLMLRAVMKLGHSVLIYRSISVASGLGCVYVIGKITGKLSVSKIAPVFTALAFGVAIPTLEIAISVRSYMLSTFFIVLSFYYFLDLLPVEGAAPTRRARILFAVSAILAVCSHYFAFFYVGTCTVVVAGFGLARPRLFKNAWVAHLFTFVPIFLVMACLYRFHISYNTTNLNHVPDYLWGPGEPKVKFLARNFHSLFNFFSPWQIVDRRHFEKVGALLVAAAIGLTPWKRLRRAIPLIMLSLIVVELAVAGCLDRYPFGGFLRQQFIVFPFAVLAAGICLDRILSLIHIRALVWASAAVLFVTLIAVAVSRFNAYPKASGELFTREMNLFDAAIPSPAGMYTDQFNLIGIYTQRHQWNWTFVERLPMPTEVEEYVLTRDSKRVKLLRDKLRWNLDFSDASLYHDLAVSMRLAKLNSLAVFCVHQGEGTLTPAQQDALEQKAFTLAKAEDLQIQKFVPDGLNIYAEFARGGQ